MFQNNLVHRLIIVALAAAMPAFAQPVAALNPAPGGVPGALPRESVALPPAAAPIPGAAPAAAAAAPRTGELTVKKLSDLQRQQVESELTAKIRTAIGADKPKTTMDRIEQCSVANYQLLSVYGMKNLLKADIALCGTAILTVSRNDEVGDGWKVSSIQTSHITVMRGKQVKQVWMPIPKEVLPETRTSATGGAGTPMSLPPLPPNLAPSPYRNSPDATEAAAK